MEQRRRDRKWALHASAVLVEIQDVEEPSIHF